MLLWMMFPLAVWGGSDKTGFFDLWKAAALPWLMSVGDGESTSTPHARPRPSDLFLARSRSIVSKNASFGLSERKPLQSRCPKVPAPILLPPFGRAGREEIPDR
jgi:hypothetical protein